MHEFPTHASFAAHQTLKNFSDETLSLNSEELRIRGERIAGSLRLFAGDRLPEPAYDNAFLLPLVRLMQDEERSQGDVAAWMLMDYLTDPENQDTITPDVLNYFESVAGDMEVIDEAVFDYQGRIREQNSAFGNQVLRSIMVENDIRIPPEQWTDARVGVNVPKMREVTHEVNVESVLVGAADLLDDLMYVHGPREQQHNILVAETFYCPALEAFGMWGMEAALRNAVNRVRLINAGRQDLIDRATEVLSPIKEIGQEAVFEQLFGEQPDGDKTRFHLNTDEPYGTTIHLFDTNKGVSVVMPQLDGLMQETEIDVRTISRIKGVESLAMKMFENPDYKDELPSDLVGMTMIVEGEAQLAALFNKIAERVASLENCHFKAAASKKQAMFVKGGDDFIESLKHKLDENLLSGIEFKSNGETTSPFQVAKMTFIMTIGGVDIPVEIQFQTVKDRERAEVGDAPHFMQKTKDVRSDMPGNVMGNPEDMADIRDRKRKLLGLGREVIAYGDNGQNFIVRLDRRAAQYMNKNLLVAA